MERLSRYRPESRAKGFLADRIAEAKVIGGILGVAGLGFFGIVAYSGIITEAYISTWAAEIKAQLQDQEHTTDRLYRRVKVVAAGNSLAEKISMQNSQTPINVRPFPATTFRNGGDVPVIGTITQGSEISKVVFTQGVRPNYALPDAWWGAFVCSDASGVTWKPGQVPKPGEICAIYGDYLVVGQ